MKVILLLAGLGTRFLPLSETTPKPLIPVAGLPVVAHILETLKGVAFDELIVITGHLSDDIESYLKEICEHPVRVIQQGALNGTGGAVYAARACIDCPVLIVFGDTIFKADMSALSDRPEANIIWTKEVEDYQRFGIVQTDEAGHMRRIIEKPQDDVGRRANIGLYYLGDYAALNAGLEHVMAGPAIGGEYFFTYALNHMIEHGRKIEVHGVEGWYDCGTLSAIIETNAYLLSLQSQAPQELREGVIIIPPVHIQGHVHLENCQIGPNVTLGAGSRVSSSTLSHTIIDTNCVLQNIDVSRSLIGPDQNLSDLTLKGCIAANGKVTKAT